MVKMNTGWMFIFAGVTIVFLVVLFKQPDPVANSSKLPSRIDNMGRTNETELARLREQAERRAELERQRHKQAIMTVLNQVTDIVNRTPPKTFKDKYWNDSDKMKGLIRQMSAIDLTACPEDFQSAYVDWTRALTDHVLKMSKYQGWSGLFGGTLALWNGEFSVSKPLAEEQQAIQEIGKTFDKMDKVILKYGIHSPFKRQ